MVADLIGWWIWQGRWSGKEREVRFKGKKGGGMIREEKIEIYGKIRVEDAKCRL